LQMTNSPRRISKISMTSKRINSNYGLNSMGGKQRYQDADFADPVNKIYPMDTEEHIRAALRYINHKDTIEKYTADQVATIKERIKKAARKHEIKITDEE